ncbi:MAG: D-alanine--D-alanine ligase family protein [bacterium]|nr:D-alanine--D-alanine ligase family protein [bacterium]
MMKNDKIDIALIFGGKSAEHEVSIVSAQNIAKTINRKKYNLTYVGINKSGQWLLIGEQEMFSLKSISSQEKTPSEKAVIPYTRNNKFYLKIGKVEKIIDVVFPILHGPFGEDGTIQGLLKLYNVPFVGSSVLGSAIGMDKDVSKRLLKEAGVPVVKFMVYKKNQKGEISFEKIKKSLGAPFFIKPANLGSSVGISKIKIKNEFIAAIKNAFSFDNKIIIEEFIKGKEIECSVLGNEKPIASIPGEIIPTLDFYSYEAKYLDENGAKMAIPANISKPLVEKIQMLAIKTFETLCCEGMGRVDFFLTEKDKIFVNEINTIPGFTLISMYPKLLEKSGISYSKLIDKLIRLAIDRYKKETRLKTDR